jgi:hypothetical protein
VDIIPDPGPARSRPAVHQDEILEIDQVNQAVPVVGKVTPPDQVNPLANLAGHFPFIISNPPAHTFYSLSPLGKRPGRGEIGLNPGFLIELPKDRRQ